MANARELVTHHGEPEKVNLQRRDRLAVNRLISANDARFNSPPNLQAAEQAANYFNTTVPDLLEDPGYQKHIQAIANSVLPPKLRRKRKGSWDRPAMERWLDKAVNARSSDSRVFALKSLFEQMVEYRDHRNMSRHTEVFAEEVAKRILMRMGADILPLRDHGSGTLDIVAVLGGKLIVIEAKGGASDLKWAYAQDDSGAWHYVQQGSLVYLRYKLREHAEILPILKTFKGGKYKDLAERLEKGEAVIEYSKVHAAYDGEDVGHRTVGDVTFTRFDLGVERTGLVAKPPPGSKPRPGRGGNPSMPEAVRKSFEQLRSIVRVPGVSPSWATARRVAAVGAGLVVLTAAVSAPANAATLFQQGARTSVDDPTLAWLKAKSAEFGRMLGSFKDYVANGLNALAVMVGDAISKVADFVSGVVDSVGAQGLIDEASKLWAEGQDLINLAMLLSPVGSVAEAINVAVTVIQTLVQHWDQIRAGFDWALKNVLVPVADFFKTAFKIYIMPYRVVFDLVMAGFNGMSGVVGGVVGTAKSVVGGIVRAIGEILQKLEIDAGPFHFGLKPLGDLMVNWASRMADGGLVRAPGAGGSVRPSGIHVMAVIDQSVVRAAREERRKVGYAYRPPFLHDGALVRTGNGAEARTIDLRVPDVDSAFAQIKSLRAQHDVRFESAGV